VLRPHLFQFPEAASVRLMSAGIGPESSCLNLAAPQALTKKLKQIWHPVPELLCARLDDCRCLMAILTCPDEVRRQPVL
jgi:hypothetical protein